MDLDPESTKSSERRGARRRCSFFPPTFIELTNQVWMDLARHRRETIWQDLEIAVDRDYTYLIHLTALGRVVRRN